MFKYVPGRKQLNFTHRFLGLMNGGFEKRFLRRFSWFKNELINKYVLKSCDNLN